MFSFHFTLRNEINKQKILLKTFSGSSSSFAATRKVKLNNYHIPNKRKDCVFVAIISSLIIKIQFSSSKHENEAIAGRSAPKHNTLVGKPLLLRCGDNAAESHAKCIAIHEASGVGDDSVWPSRMC